MEIVVVVEDAEDVDYVVGALSVVAVQWTITGGEIAL